MASTSERAQIPELMKAEVIDRYGDPEVMHTALIPVPQLGDDEVLIRVATAGVGAWDPELVAGGFGDASPAFPQVLGSDGSGTVVACGRRVRRFDPGDLVYGWGFLNPKGGFYAEYAALPEDEVERLPAGLDLDHAGPLAIDALTALAGLDELSLGGDDTLMIVGASGGVGHMAVQLAKRIGSAWILAIASGDDGMELARQLGADAALDGRDPAVALRARALVPYGVDAALVLAPASAQLLALVHEGGRVAFPHGVAPTPQRRGAKVTAFDGYHGRDALDRLNRLLAGDSFRVEVSCVYPLEQTPAALRDVKQHHLGKLAVKVDGR
jgi:NADPH:quinone reductase-like Zn-dependent oxidoreductase